MSRRRLLRNVAFAVLQVLVVTASLFYLYGFLLRTIGVQRLGIWSLVLASTSLTGIGSFGMSGSVVKFVAKYHAREAPIEITRFLQTALWSIVAIGAVVLAIAYPICAYLLSKAMPVATLPQGLAILPQAIFAVWLMLIGSVVYSGLDGVQRIDLRGIVLMSGSIMNVLLCVVLVRRFGLAGVAWAKIGQNLFLLLVSGALLARFLGSAAWISPGWHRSYFKEAIGYGVNFQLMSIANFLCDPLTKGLLSRFGSLEMVGFYDMAARMVTQLRSVIISANGVIVPVIAAQQEKNPDRVGDMYLQTYRVVFLLALPAYTGVIVCIPWVSTLWIGHYEPEFAIFGTLLACGWLINTLNAPSFFSFLGTGQLKWCLAAQIAVSALSAILGFSLGALFGGFGVALGWALALGLGSNVTLWAFHRAQHIPLGEILPKPSRWIAAACVVTAGASLFLQFSGTHLDALSNSVALTFVYTLLIVGLLWLHPLRRSALRPQSAGRA